MWSGQGTLQNDALHSEGALSLKVTPTGTSSGFIGVRNLTPLTKDEQVAPEVVGFDVWIPAAQVNPNWHGDVQLTIDAPSAGIYQQYLGYRSFQDLPKDQFVRVEFPVADWIRTALDAANYTDLRFVIAINTTARNPPHYLDNFTLGPIPENCTPTDDGNPCTADECNPATGQTAHVPLAPGALCSDVNVCNGTEACDGAGTCEAGTPLVVDDENPCTTDSCDQAEGVSNTPVTAGTACDDGDACNGGEFCDAEGACQDAPDLEVDDGNPCTVDTCDPVTGVNNDPAPEGTSCADSDVCNGEETCSAAGTCQAGTPLAIDDGNVCTADSCDPLAGVSNQPLAAGTSCDDGDACNGVSTCDGALMCVAGIAPTIDDGNECTADSCDPVTGVTNIPVSAGISCGDGNACNGEEACNGAGACLAGSPPEIDDNNPCTADACDPNGGVTHTPVSAGVSCGDGNACNGAEVCDGVGACQGGTPIETDDGNECTIGSCEPETGAVTQEPVPAGAACGDGDICNGSEFCDGAGACESGTPLDPDDGNACTVDSCDPLFGVDNTPAAAGTECQDGDVCNGEEACDGFGACQAGTPLETDDANSCTADSCDPVAGVAHQVLDDGANCSDGNACTTEDSCQSGACVGGDPIVCGALSTCHEAGVCNPATGLCSDPVKPDGSTCDDGVACSAGDACEAGACVGGDSPVMEEAPCQVAECDGETGGVVYTRAEEGSSCQLDACTRGVCSAEGECLATETTVVDDLDPCTVDFCDPILGPVNVACSEIDMTVATTVLSAYSWLFTGAFPVQTGVNPADIEERRAALISGVVTNLAGDALPSVTVTVHGHPEFGRTVTQANGAFQMVVNGGGTMQVQLHKAGYLDSARRVEPKWNQTHTVDDVIMIVPDLVVTEISLDDAGEDFQVAQSSIVSDEDGERQGTLLVPPGTVATMRLPDGTEQMLDTMHVRITEFTVGPEGPDAMPASLPANTGYTYAFEVNADEAVAAGAPSIEFSEPLVYYVENFIGFPVGETVPVGAYDRERGLWVPHDSGVVIEILSINAGVASVDLTGNGTAATPAELTAAGITPAEQERLGALYNEGTRLWRVLIPHFTQPYDCNWPFHFPEDAEPPPAEEPEPDDPPPPEYGCEHSQASTIECQAQVLREEVAVAGSPFSLHYSSARVPGRVASKFDITLTGDSPPASLKRVDLRVVVGGREFKQSFPPSPEQVVTFDWDRMDAWGRVVQGRRTAAVEVRYAYDGVYGRATRFNNPSLGHFPASLSGNRARGELFITQKWTVPVGGWVSEELGLGGWTLGAQHYYDPVSGTLLRGDGTQVRQDARGAVVQNVLGEFPGDFSEGVLARSVRFNGTWDFDAAPDGTVYLCSGVIYRIDPEGHMYTVRDSEQQQIACTSLAVGANGDLYFRLISNAALRRMDNEGVITTIAGVATGFPTEGQPAAESPLGAAYAFATARDGSVYIADASNRRIYRIGTDGILTRVAGVGQTSNSAPADGSEALTTPIQPQQIAVDEEGVVYVVARAIWPGAGGTSAAIYSLGADGLWQHLAGCRNSTNCSEDWNGPPQNARLATWNELAVGENKNIYFATAHPTEGQKLIVINSAGRIRSLIGHTPNWVRYMSGAPASQVNHSVARMAIGPQGVLLYGTAASSLFGVNVLSQLTGMLPSLGLDEMLVPDESGSEVYHFDDQGRHVRTLHGHTYATLRTFEYEEHGFLSGVTDSNGLVTVIERDSDGNPLAVVAPYGQRTSLTVGADGYLSDVNLPGDRDHSMTYDSGGLLTTYTGPTGVPAFMTYDGDGRLVLDLDREGAPMSLARTNDADGWNVLRTTAEGRAFDYRVEYRENDVEFTQNSFPDGTSSSTTRNAGGNSVTVLPDGTQVEVALQPDPSFGILSPQSSRIRTVPSGLSQAVATSRVVSLSEQYNPSSLTLFIDTTTVNGLQSQTRFTRNDLRYRSTTPQGRVSDQFIDQTGRMIRLETAGSPTVRTQYDADKVSAIVIDPDTNPSNGNERVTQMFYDSAGRLTSVRDPLTNETFFGTFDDADRPQAITLPDESEVLMTLRYRGECCERHTPR